jgi:archaellum component FlaF (FlaF/FlaG flagellin family)
MSKSKKYFFLFSILIIAFFLRFYHLTTTPPGLYPDEAINGNNAVQVIQTEQFKVFYPENNGREGLYINCLAILLKEFPIYEPWMIRLPSAIAGFLTVIGLYLLTEIIFRKNKKELVDSENDKKEENKIFNVKNINYSIALLATFFIATSFWHINFSRIGFRAILSPLLLVWSLYFFMLAIKTASKIKTIIYPAIAGIIFGLGFYTYIAYRVTPIIFLLFIPFFGKEKMFWKKTIIFVLFTFITAMPIGMYFLGHPTDFFGRTTQISVTNSSNPIKNLAINTTKTALMFNFHGDENWRQNISGEPELFWPVGILFILGIIIGFYSLLKSFQNKTFLKNESDILQPFATSLTFLWIIIASLPAIISNEGIPHALRSILMIPPAMIFAGIGGVWFYQKMNFYIGITYSKIIAIIFILTVLIFGYVNYFVIWGQNQNVPGAFTAQYVQIGNQINAMPNNVSKYVIVNASGVLVNGIPMPAQTTMFITNSFLPKDAENKNIHYLLPNETSSIPLKTPQNQIFYIN